MSAQQFRISQAPWFKPLGAVLGGGHGAVEVTADEVQVRFGAMFRAHVPRSAVRGARPATGPVLGWGAHGWRGRWLVNGSSKGRVTLEIDPVQRAWVTGVPGQAARADRQRRRPRGPAGRAGRVAQPGALSRRGTL